MNTQNIPQELKNHHQWLVWKLEERNGKTTKLPYNANTGGRGKTNDPSTWSSLDGAMEALATKQYSGIGFALSGNDGLTGIDIDLPPTDPIAKQLINEFKDTYCELSPSGNVRIFALGNAQRSGKGTTNKKLEVYDHNSPRYLTVTGNHIPETNTEITNQQTALDRMHDNHFKPKIPPKKQTAAPHNNPINLSLEELLNKARNAKNGGEFIRLYDTGDFGSDQSSADIKLCGILSFWLNRDYELIDLAFRQSALLRDKWDVKHHSDGTTYGQSTINTAIDNCSKTYTKEKTTTKPIKTNSETQEGGHDSKQLAYLMDMELVERLSKKYAYLACDDEFINTVSGNTLKGTALSNLYADKTAGKIPIHRLLLKSKLCPKANRTIYWPGKKESIFQYQGEKVINTWNPTQKPIPKDIKEGDIDLWLDHAEYIIPDTKHRDHVFNWMAFMLQNQDIKINHAILLAGGMRVGKDTLFQPLIHGIGESNVTQPEGGELQEQYTNYLLNTKLVMFQEVQNFDKASIENKLKPMLAAPPEELRIRVFNKGFFTCPNLVQAVFMSNYRNALKISEGDGRYFALWTDAKRLSEDYYNELYSWLNDQGNALVVRWLLNRDVSNFNPKAPAPHTDYKTQIQELGKTSLEMEIEDKIAAYDPPFTKDIIRIDDSTVDSLSGSKKLIENALINLGCDKAQCRRSTGKREKYTFWIIRNQEEYKKLSQQELIRQNEL